MTQGVFALERVLAVEPTNDLARAEIARAYFILGERETARQEFTTVQQSGQAPDEAIDTINKYLALLDQARVEEGRRISGYIEMSLGYDTNINSATDQSQIILPLLPGIQFQLDGNAQEQESEYMRVAGTVNASHPISEHWDVVAGARGYYRLTDKPFSTQDAYGYVGVAAEYGKHRMTAAGTAENFEIDGNTLRNIYGGFAQWIYAIDDQSRFNLSVQGSNIQFAAIGARNVDRYTFAAGYIRALRHARRPVIYGSVYGGMEDENDKAFPQFGHDFYGGSIGGSLQILGNARAFANFALEHRDYNGPDALFFTVRDDTQFIVTTGIEFELVHGWKIIPEVSYINNDSNIVLSDYDRVVAGVRARFSF